jgi:predicted glycosyltransferase
VLAADAATADALASPLESVPGDVLGLRLRSLQERASENVNRALADGRDDLRVLDFVPDGDTLVALADDVVAMGGYNTVCEILASGTRALVVPRAEPGREQIIRARRLSDLGALDVLQPQRLSAAALSTWLGAGGGAGRAPRTPIDMNGVRRVPALLRELMALPAVRWHEPGAITPTRRFARTSPAPATSTGSVSA